MPERGEALSEREMEVLRLVATGATNDQIARDLVISVNTVKVHLRNIFVKLGVASRTEASLQAVRAGWVTLTTPPAGEATPPAETTVAAPPARPVASHWSRWLALASIIILVLSLVFALTDLPRRWIFPSTPVPTPSVITSDQRWTVHTAMPTSRGNLALVLFRDSLYAIGGDGPEGVSDATERFDIAADRWTSLASKPTAVADAQGAVLGGRIYVPGGRDAQGRPTAVTEAYDVKLNRWTVVSSLPLPLSGYALVAFEGKLYIFGGWDGSSYRDEILTYNYEADSWEPMGRMPFPLGYAGAVVDSDHVLLIGGVDARGPVDVILEYYPATGDFSPPQPLPGVSLGHVRATILTGNVTDKNLYVLADPDGSSAPQVWEHNIQTERWATIDPSPAGLYPGAAIAGIPTEIYLVGGKNGKTALSLTQEYKAIYVYVVSPGRGVSP